MITVTWQTLITIASLVTAATVILSKYNKAYDMIKHQGEQDNAIKNIQQENTLLLKGVLACLQGLSEQGCDGPVHEAEAEIKDYLINNHGQK